MTFERHVIKPEPPPHSEQLNKWIEDNTKSQMFSTILSNYAHYLRGEAYAKHCLELKDDADVFWEKTAG